MPIERATDPVADSIVKVRRARRSLQRGHREASGGDLKGHAVAADGSVGLQAAGTREEKPGCRGVGITAEIQVAVAVKVRLRAAGRAGRTERENVRHLQRPIGGAAADVGAEERAVDDLQALIGAAAVGAGGSRPDFEVDDVADAIDGGGFSAACNAHVDHQAHQLTVF